MRAAKRSHTTTLRSATTVLYFALGLTALFAACEDAGSSLTSSAPHSMSPAFTMGAGTASTLLGRGNFGGAFKVVRETGNWEAEIEVKPGLDLAVQTIVFQPGGHSGWHRHPGPVFILVATGTMTFYESDDPDCKPIVRSTGQGYLDTGEHAHIARNETPQPAQNVVTYFAPPAAALRIDAPDPGHCRF